MRLHRIPALACLALASAVLAQDAAKVSPRTYKVVFEDDRVRVLEYVSKPGLGVCGQGRHYHPAHLTMQLTDLKIKVTEENGGSKTADVPAGPVNSVSEALAAMGEGWTSTLDGITLPA